MGIASKARKPGTILVTGGAGFVGFHVAKALLERGDNVVVVDNFNDYYDPALKHARIAQLKPHSNLTVYEADISDYRAMEEVFDRHAFDKICHLGAQAGVRYSLMDPFKYELSNNAGTLNILELSRLHEIKDIVYASSSSVYGGNQKTPFSEDDPVNTPISFYAATKRSNELYAHVYHHLYGMNCTGLRFFTVYGPWGRPDMALFKFTKAILDDEPIEVYNNGKMKRDFTYCDDVAKGVIAALDRPFPYEIINLGNNSPIELLRFIELIEEATGKKARKILMPAQPGDLTNTYADISKAKSLLGFEPSTSVETGVKNFVKWYREFYKK